MIADKQVREVLERAWAGKAPSRQECVALLACPPESLEASMMRVAADQLSRRRFGNTGYLSGQVIMVAGNTVKVPHSALDSVRTLTANIAMEMGYATGLHRQALFATGVVLFVVIMILNTLAMTAMRKRGGRG